MNIENLIKIALEKKSIITLDYEGTRLVEPYILFKNQAGNYYLDCYQLSGKSRSGHPQGWKMMLFNKITKVKSTNDQFKVRREYNPQNRNRYRIIIAKV
jgi:hypothetical protein